MARFKVKNLMEIEDSSRDRTEGKVEARFARKRLDSKHMRVSYFRYAPGFRLPMGHRRREPEEAYVVVGGSGRMRLDDEIAELRRWDATACEGAAATERVSG